MNESIHSIRFQDCDPFNHLNNAKYIDYFISAREDHLIDFYKFDLYEYIKSTRKGWVVSQSHIAYFSPASLMEKVVIQSELIELNSSDIMVEMQMWNINKTHCKALFWIKFVHIDLIELKKVEHPSIINELFFNVVNSSKRKPFFEERILDFKKNKQ